MTEEEFDIHEPYRCYAFMFLLFDCHRCQRYFDLNRLYPADADWRGFTMLPTKHGVPVGMSLPIYPMDQTRFFVFA